MKTNHISKNKTNGAIVATSLMCLLQFGASAQQPMPDAGNLDLVPHCQAPADGAPEQKPNQPDNKPVPPPAPHKRIEAYIGPDAGVFLPTNSKTKSRFGSAWFDFGPSFGSVYEPKLKGKISPDIHILSKSNNNDTLFFVLLGVEYRRSMLPDHKLRRTGDATPPDAKADKKPGDDANVPLRRPNYIPFFGGSADFMVGDLRSVEDNIHSGVRTGASGSAFVGVTYHNRAYIEMRYREASTVKSFDLSGFSVNLGVRFKVSL